MRRLDLRREKAARVEFDEVLRLDPAEPLASIALLGIARILVREDELKKAWVLLDRLAKRFENSRLVHLLLADVLIELGQAARVIPVVNRVLRTDPRCAAALAAKATGLSSSVGTAPGPWWWWPAEACFPSTRHDREFLATAGCQASDIARIAGENPISRTGNKYNRGVNRIIRACLGEEHARITTHLFVNGTYIYRAQNSGNVCLLTTSATPYLREHYGARAQVVATEL